MTKTALLLIDIQNDYFPDFEGSKMPLPHMAEAAANAALLLADARTKGTTVVHIQHVMSSDAAPFFHTGTIGSEIHPSVAPTETETVVEKPKANSFVDTDLLAYLRSAQIDHLLVCGAMSQMCVDATVRAASDLGFSVTVAFDACAAANVEHNGVSVPADMVHASIMAPLAARYATLKPTSSFVTGS